MVKVAINGFGRIGRLAFRQMFGAEGYEVVAINDLTSPKMLAHLLKYDTAQGSYCGHIGENKHTVEATEDSIIVDGKEIKIYAEKDAANCPWGKLDVDVVLECTGFYCSKEKSQAHINAGAKKVVISAPAGNDLKTIVYSVNETELTKDDQIISAASCGFSISFEPLPFFVTLGIGQAILTSSAAKLFISSAISAPRAMSSAFAPKSWSTQGSSPSPPCRSSFVLRPLYFSPRALTISVCTSPAPSIL